MAKEINRDYHPGDWIVHIHHGVGKIKSVEEKELGGNSTTYYKVVTNDSTLWVPLDKAEDDWFRPLASPEELDEVIEILQKPPDEMHSSHNVRRRRIYSVKSSGSLQDVARLVRDLSGRRAKQRLNNTEERALRRFTDHLLQEWSICLGLDEEAAREQMQEVLDRSTAQEATAEQA